MLAVTLRILAPSPALSPVAHLAQVILQVQVLSTSCKAQEEVQEGLVLMNHCQVQCPENKNRGQKAQVKYSCIHSFNKLC